MEVIPTCLDFPCELQLENYGLKKVYRTQSCVLHYTTMASQGKIIFAWCVWSSYMCENVHVTVTVGMEVQQFNGQRRVMGGIP